MAFTTLQKGMTLSGSIEDYPEGIVIPIDKPYRWTSADVIRKIKWAACRHFGRKNLKVGHAGTLDPLATGVLLVCIGPATRRAEEFQRHDKEYIADISFGATTPSYDLEKSIDKVCPVDGVSREALLQVLPGLTGPQEQIAPLFSAKSVDGVRAYELARKAWRAAATSGAAGSVAFDKAEASLARRLDSTAESILTKQNIVISDLELLDFAEKPFCGPSQASCNSGKPNPRINVADISGYNLPTARIRIACSKGTYIRAFARDLGEALGSGAFLTALQRSRSGFFRVEDSLSIDDAMDCLI